METSDAVGGVVVVGGVGVVTGYRENEVGIGADYVVVVAEKSEEELLGLFNSGETEDIVGMGRRKKDWDSSKTIYKCPPKIRRKEEEEEEEEAKLV